MKSLMKTRKQKETGEKEVHLLEQKGYEKMVNEIVPVQIVWAAEDDLSSTAQINPSY